MGPPRGIEVLCAALALGGCGPALGGCGASANDQVRAKVQQFGKAVKSRDYKALCDDVLAPSLVAHLTLNRISCEQAMRVGLARVRDPTLSIGEVTVIGKTASVITLSMALGQQSSLDTIGLVETAHGWRISSLSSPIPTGAPPP
jgi:hypothetical protein